jgi:hypothetical protein
MKSKPVNWADLSAEWEAAMDRLIADLAKRPDVRSKRHIELKGWFRPSGGTPTEVETNFTIGFDLPLDPRRIRKEKTE